MILFHRGHEHSGRMAHLVEELGLNEFDFFAWDARGHGQSPGERGDAPSFSACVQDIQYFVQHLQAEYNIQPENIAIVAQSVGAVLAATWVHDYAPKIRALCLASPAFDIKLYVPFAKPGLNLLSKVRGNFFINSYVKAKMLTHDQERAKSYDTDPQIAPRHFSQNVTWSVCSVRTDCSRCTTYFLCQRKFFVQAQTSWFSKNLNVNFMQNCHIH